MARTKRADQVRELYKLSNNWTRKQWEFINQKAYDFAHDDQLKETDIGTPKPPSGIFSGLRERLSVAGQEREQTGETALGIYPSARVFKLPPTRFYSRVF